MAEVDVNEIVGCTCLRLRRTTRRVTQLYDTLLQPAGLTVNQFGLLAYLYGADAAGRGGLAIGVLADRVGMDPTTLTRNLKPLAAQRLIADRFDPNDRRVRLVIITEKGRAALREAVPLWRKAQRRVEAALGAETTRALNGLLDLSRDRLSD